MPAKIHTGMDQASPPVPTINHRICAGVLSPSLHTVY